MIIVPVTSLDYHDQWYLQKPDSDNQISLSSLIGSLFDPDLTARKNALFQTTTHHTGSDVTMLLSLSFDVGDEDESAEDECHGVIDQGQG